jgi:hypothetical protein
MTGCAGCSSNAGMRHAMCIGAGNVHEAKGCQSPAIRCPLLSLNEPTPDSTGPCRPSCTVFLSVCAYRFPLPLVPLSRQSEKPAQISVRESVRRSLPRACRQNTQWLHLRPERASPLCYAQTPASLPSLPKSSHQLRERAPLAVLALSHSLARCHSSLCHIFQPDKRRQVLLRVGSASPAVWCPKSLQHWHISGIRRVSRLPMLLKRRDFMHREHKSERFAQPVPAHHPFGESPLNTTACCGHQSTLLSYKMEQPSGGVPVGNMRRSPKDTRAAHVASC